MPRRFRLLTENPLLDWVDYDALISRPLFIGESTPPNPCRHPAEAGWPLPYLENDDLSLWSIRT